MFKSFPLDQITVNREARQRTALEPKDISSLADSISRLGLINPITIDSEGVLIAGETRMAACALLGWTHIPVQIFEELSELERVAIELEENIKRKDISWQDQVAAIKKYHELKQLEDPKWTQIQTAESLGIHKDTINDKIAVAKELEKGNARIVDAPKYSTARGIISRQNERARADEGIFLQPLREVEQILNVDFLQWAPSYDGPPFNLLNCDFPYGIGADTFNQGSAASFGGYVDEPDTYWALVNALIEHREKLLGDSCHILFWYSMRWHSETFAALSRVFSVNPYPLIWHKSDNKGTLPDPQRGPRQVYEAAFLCSVGDRKIISAKSNVFSGPTLRAGEHMSEKSEDMLKFFFEMFVDGKTRLLDPTAGSGSALRAALALGAESVLGLELNPEFAENAKTALRKVK